MTSRKRILEVNIWPWQTMGSPSGPSQQSSSTQRHPIISALHRRMSPPVTPCHSHHTVSPHVTQSTTTGSVLVSPGPPHGTHLA